jgi:hypothetical protein
MSRNTIPGPIINAMLLKYTALILKILLFLTCCECEILSYASVVAISRVQMIQCVRGSTNIRHGQRDGWINWTNTRVSP